MPTTVSTPQTVNFCPSCCTPCPEYCVPAVPTSITFTVIGTTDPPGTGTCRGFFTAGDSITASYYAANGPYDDPFYPGCRSYHTHSYFGQGPDACTDIAGFPGPGTAHEMIEHFQAWGMYDEYSCTMYYGLYCKGRFGTCLTPGMGFFLDASTTINAANPTYTGTYTWYSDAHTNCCYQNIQFTVVIA